MRILTGEQDALATLRLGEDDRAIHRIVELLKRTCLYRKITKKKGGAIYMKQPGYFSEPSK